MCRPLPHLGEGYFWPVPDWEAAKPTAEILGPSVGDKALGPWRMKGRHPEVGMNLPPAKRASFILEYRAVSCIPRQPLKICFHHTGSILGRKHPFIKGING